MPLTYRLHRKALAELDEAINWYKKQGGKKLASRFFSHYQKLRDKILENPFQFAETEMNCRQAVFTTFPFVIIFYPTGHEVFILAVFHTSRNPEEWKART